MADAQKKLPSIQWYPGDWRKDPGVQALDYHHRGVWFEVLMLMHESADRGRLELNGQPMPDSAIARLLGLPADEWVQVRAALLDYGVASEDEDGALICRRTVRDEQTRRQKETLSHTRAEAGRKGGRATQGAKQKASKTEAPPLAPPQANSGGDSPHKTRASSGSGSSKVRAKPKQKGGSSSSSSSSSSTSVKKKAPAEPKKKHPIPDDWKPTEEHRQLANRERANLEREVEQFRDHAAATGRVLLDWDAAFRTWLRNATKFGGANRRRATKEGHDSGQFGRELDEAMIRQTGGLPK